MNFGFTNYQKSQHSIVLFYLCYRQLQGAATSCALQVAQGMKPLAFSCSFRAVRGARDIKNSLI
jgi:hypothetical protein